MTQPCVLLVEPDILVRHPLAQYLRDCGYEVAEAVDATEAHQIVEARPTTIDVVLVEAQRSGPAGFGLAAWLRAEHPGIRVLLAGSIAKAAATAGDLCDEGPTLTKPYDHQLVLDEIRRLLAARARGER